MHVRRRCLPAGWYPTGAAQTASAIDAMARRFAADGLPGIAGVAPHAGWEFSGSLALEVVSRISRGMDTIVIIGGHLGPSDGIMCAFEDAYETPLGPIPADRELLEALRTELRVREDVEKDNTVEVQLPLVRHEAPGARVLGMRAPPSPLASELGRAISRLAAKLRRHCAVLGSTDLTHYGPDYGFAPAGSPEEALRWVREENDRGFIDSLVGMDADAALHRALHDRSACSAGGAVAAMSYARENGVRTGTLLRYATSLDVHPARSFVGYAGILYS